MLVKKYLDSVDTFNKGGVKMSERNFESINKLLKEDVDSDLANEIISLLGSWAELKTENELLKQELENLEDIIEDEEDDIHFPDDFFHYKSNTTKELSNRETMKLIKELNDEILGGEEEIAKALFTQYGDTLVTKLWFDDGQEYIFVSKNYFELSIIND